MRTKLVINISTMPENKIKQIEEIATAYNCNFERIKIWGWDWFSFSKIIKKV
jgi:hypothetical protein